MKKSSRTLPVVKFLNDNDWRAIIDNEHNVTINSAKFIFAQAEKRLDDTIKTFDALTTKAIALISFSGVVLSTLMAYFFVNFDPSGQYDVKLITSFICAFYTASVLVNFINIVLPKVYFPMGSLPQDLYVDKRFTNEMKEYDLDIPELFLYLSEIEDYNRRIISNIYVNEDRANEFRKSVYLICLMPVIGLLFYFFLISPLSPLPR